MVSNWKISFTEKFKKNLKDIDKKDQKRILNYMYDLTKTSNPRMYGKFLVNSKIATLRYRIGNYRVLCNIIDSELLILAVDVGKRSEIYSKL